MAPPLPTPAPAYRKLTRLKRGLGVLTQLWLGADHLLYVNSNGYTETYRRFYFRDIQSLLIVHTARRTYYATALLVVLLFLVMIVNVNGGGIPAFMVIVGIFAALLAWNHLLGAGCRVVIVTAVQQENIRCLSRLPKTRRVLREIQPLIEAAQIEHLNPPAPATPLAPPAVPGEMPPLLSPASLPPPLPPP
jgi:hypothetical protein